MNDKPNDKDLTQNPNNNPASITPQDSKSKENEENSIFPSPVQLLPNTSQISSIETGLPTLLSISAFQEESLNEIEEETIDESFPGTNTEEDLNQSD